LVHRADMRTAIFASLGDHGSDEWTTAELNRAIDEVTADISRWMPRELVEEYVLRSDVTGESFTSSHNVEVALGNKPIEFESETVTSSPAGTTYTRNTDYEIDWKNGKINVLSTGSMANTTAFLISYTKSRIGIDISGLTDLLAVTEVQLVASGTPKDDVSFTTWGDFLTITGIGRSSQAKWDDEDSLRVYYHGQHTAPTDSANGTFPRFLDQIAIKGAIAYSLYTKHRILNIRAGKSVESSRSALLSSASAMHDFNTAITQLKTTATTGPYARIDHTITKLSTGRVRLSNALLGWTKTSGARSRIETALTAVSTTDDGPYAKITTSLNLIAARMTAAETALSNAATGDEAGQGALNQVATRYGEAKTALDLIAGVLDQSWKTGDTGYLKKAEDIWTTDAHAQDNYINQGISSHTHIEFGAEDYLEVGDNLINASNVGSDVAEHNRRYAETSLGIAQQFADRRRDYIDASRALIEEARAYALLAEQRTASASVSVGEASSEADIARNYLQEAAQEIDQSRTYVEGASEWNAKGRLYIAEAQGWKDEAILYFNEADRWIADMDRVIAECRLWIDKADRYLLEAQRHVEKHEAIVSRANVHIQSAQMDTLIAEKFLEDATMRHRDYLEILGSRVEMARSTSRSSTRQYGGSDKQTIDSTSKKL
jgi:hypothetical protein